jgi:hypothetical protein
MSFVSTFRVRLLTGEILEVEFRPQETYRSMYQTLWNALPEDIQPTSIYQMNLLLEEELVPLNDCMASVSEKIYGLLIDPISYDVRLTKRPFDAIVSTNSAFDAFDQHYVLTVVIVSNEQKFTYDLLYNQKSNHFYDPHNDEIEWEWQEGCRGYREDAVHFWINPDAPYFDGSIMSVVLVARSKEYVEFSMAGERTVREKLMNLLSDVNARDLPWYNEMSEDPYYPYQDSYQYQQDYDDDNQE